MPFDLDSQRDPTPPTVTIRERLLTAIAEASADELRVLAIIADRLALGRRRYGPLCLDRDRRDFRAEAAEELIDSCVYSAADALKRGLV